MNTWQPWQVRTQRKSMINKRKEKKDKLAKDRTREAVGTFDKVR